MISTQESAPYVVSADVHRLLKAWAPSRGLCLPPQSFFDYQRREMQSVLGKYFKGAITIISEGEMYGGMLTLASESALPLVSLDRAYLDDGDLPDRWITHLDLTRVVGPDGKQLEGLYPRSGTPTLEKQLEKVKSIPTPLITLVDDVIFSGDGHAWLINKLAEIGKTVGIMIAGIGVGKGVDRFRQKGIEVECVLEYRSVVDEVCERDFYAGVPYSGRTIKDSNNRFVGAPYFRPLGDPTEWASIPPEYANDFSEYCLESSIDLWRYMEKFSGRPISTQELPRPTYGLHEPMSVVNALIKYRQAARRGEGSFVYA